MVQTGHWKLKTENWKLKTNIIYLNKRADMAAKLTFTGDPEKHRERGRHVETSNIDSWQGVKNVDTH